MAAEVRAADLVRPVEKAGTNICGPCFTRAVLAGHWAGQRDCSTMGDFRSDQFLPAAGEGLRFNLDKKNDINYRVAFAFGREGHTLSIGVGEAC